MLIKYMDELAQSGRYDLQDDGDRSVYLVGLNGFSADKGLAEWEIVGETSVPRKQLYYNDTADGSNTLNGSWREFYAAQCALGDRPLYSGSSIFYKDGFPNFGGVAKAAIYLRYSAGFRSWLATFDAAASESLTNELPVFEKLMDNPGTKKMMAKWSSFKPPRDQWALPVVCRLSDGSLIVLGLSGTEADDWEDLTDLKVNLKRSLELMSFLTTPAATAKEVISELFQMGGGLGRNAFGQDYKLDAITDSEYTRLMGSVPATARAQLLDIWANKLEYRIKVAPNPDSSTMVFMPEGDLCYSRLKTFIDAENARRSAFWTAKESKKKKSTEEVEATVIHAPDIIPVPACAQATVFLVNIEGSQKKKLIIQQIFPSISLTYLRALNDELLHHNLQFVLVGYMKKALTCQDRDTPCVYRYWTEVFTAALQRHYVNAGEVFNSFQRFCKAFRGDELINAKEVIKSKARDYFRVIALLRRLQHLIDTAGIAPDRLETIEFNNELTAVEQYQFNAKGVFDMSPTACPSAAELLGEVYPVLRDYEKSKIDAFIRQAWQGIPNRDFPLVIHGALVGILLNELTYAVKSAGRSFSVTQGRHPSTLRGDQILSVFSHGIGLLMNLDKAQVFNGNVMPFVTSCLAESRKDAFNSGLIMGMVFIHKSEKGA